MVDEEQDKEENLVNKLGEKLRQANISISHNPFYVASMEIVRRSGLVNMMSKKGVVQVLREFELDSYADYIEDLTKEEYLELLKDLEEAKNIWGEIGNIKKC